MNDVKVNIELEVPKKYFHQRDKIDIWFRYIEDAIAYKSESRYEDDFKLDRYIVMGRIKGFKYKRTYKRL